MTDQSKANPELVAEIRRQVLEELRNEEARKAEEQRLRREDEEKSYNTYINKMKTSPSPWVEVKGIVHDPKMGVRIELDWNEAFIKHLRDNGYTGADDDTVIHRYVAELSYLIANDMEEQENEHE